MFWRMVLLTYITAIMNEITIITFLQFDVINIGDAAWSTTDVGGCLCLNIICAHCNKSIGCVCSHHVQGRKRDQRRRAELPPLSAMFHLHVAFAYFTPFGILSKSIMSVCRICMWSDDHIQDFERRSDISKMGWPFWRHLSLLAPSCLQTFFFHDKRRQTNHQPRTDCTFSRLHRIPPAQSERPRWNHECHINPQHWQIEWMDDSVRTTNYNFLPIKWEGKFRSSLSWAVILEY